MSAAGAETMASPADEAWESFIGDIRPRLKELVVVEPLLDHVHFIGPEQKELILQRARREGDRAAADLLIDAVIRRPHPAGWFRAFVDALVKSGCDYAADIIQAGLPEPEVEAENDEYVRLIQILSPSLVQMKTDEVCVHCLAEGLVTEEDSEKIKAETTSRGPRSGARELLRRIVRGRPGWFSKFLHILRETEHQSLYELTGGSPDCDKEGLFAGASAECEQLPKSQKPSQSDGTVPEAAARGPERTDIRLRDYQMDVARPALEGKNIIICLPTGSGKTRVAVYITKEHLDGRRAEGQSGKVVVLVNKIPLVEQHYSAEFLPFLKPTYKVERVSGDCQLKISFTEILKKNDVVICTAQILENHLERSITGEDEGVKLSDLTLIIIDECHHTQKGEVYNHIMMRYLKQKHKNEKMKKEQRETVPLPQILGLTASPGVGGANNMKKAVEHILRICANLDAYKIMTSSLGDCKKNPNKQTLSVEDRIEDPFGDVIKKIMNAIHTHANLSTNCDLGSQRYEQWVVTTEREAAAKEDHKVRVCAEYLRQYSEALNLSNIIRMCDAFRILNEYYEKEIHTKMNPDEMQIIQITDTERFLFNLFKENKEELQTLAGNPQYENDSLSKLRGKILHEFSSREAARGIIFTKTRISAIALSHWIQENPKFADIGVKASYVIGGGDQSVVKPMTSAEQRDVLKNFHNGDVNLLIATTVAEEGLDIAACNFVIRYGLVTNEISMIQAEGRGRAEDSTYTLVDVKNSGVAEKEWVNEYRKKMMNKAIENIGSLNQADYKKQIIDFQFQAITEKRVRLAKKKQKKMTSESPSDVKFTCRGCSKHVCNGDDIQVIESMHRVNVTEQFSELYIERENPSPQERPLDLETKGSIACKKCGRGWGVMMVYHGIECPCLNVQNFVVTLNEKTIPNCTKWSKLAVRFSAFDYAEQARQMASSSDEMDTT
ncbi:interferon-induced helicase C domain-containing protein 1 [Hippoglossus hippoglossus]|uniref:interferon-induced helicase C domain-containing protein 1 n=1 Tax=Hippoglossus hippoglossus TaxID=8267 RepID=UPI00148C66C7|nr:interferon-induced helicase C domain-containing protein 1 [Hippoglossus hippoglossus]